MPVVMTQPTDEHDGDDEEKARRAVTAAVTAGVTVTLLAVCAAAGSYTTVSGLAASHGIDLHWLAPAEIDGGLLGVILLDITLTWARMPLWWLRLAARVFAAGTVAANAAAGWPSPVGAGLRCAAPLLIVVITEAGRAALLYRERSKERKRKAGERQERRDNRIPPVRWVLDPAGTFGLWRRMKLRGETSYAAALDAEAARRAAIGALAGLYGADQWRAKAPQDLVWMLKSGTRMAAVMEKVAVLTDGRVRQSGDGRMTGPHAADGDDDGRGTVRREAVMAGSAGGRAASAGRDGGDVGGGRRAGSSNLSRARELVKRKPWLLEPGMGAQLAQELGVSERTGQRLHKRLVSEAAAAEAAAGGGAQ